MSRVAVVVTLLAAATVGCAGDGCLATPAEGGGGTLQYRLELRSSREKLTMEVVGCLRNVSQWGALDNVLVNLAAVQDGTETVSLARDRISADMESACALLSDDAAKPENQNIPEFRLTDIRREPDGVALRFVLDTSLIEPVAVEVRRQSETDIVRARRFFCNVNLLCQQTTIVRK